MSESIEVTISFFPDADDVIDALMGDFENANIEAERNSIIRMGKKDDGKLTRTKWVTAQITISALAAIIVSANATIQSYLDNQPERSIEIKIGEKSLEVDGTIEIAEIQPLLEQLLEGPKQ